MFLQPGEWGIPCGFLDWGESAAEAVDREVQEELGIRLTEYGNIPNQPSLVVSEPNPAENETVSLRFVVDCNVDNLPTLTPGMPEVTDVRWLEIAWSIAWQEEKLAFNHTEIIKWAQSLGCSS